MIEAPDCLRVMIRFPLWGDGPLVILGVCVRGGQDGHRGKRLSITGFLESDASICDTKRLIQSIGEKGHRGESFG